MNDERFKELLDLDPQGFPSLAEVTKEVMRGPGLHVGEPTALEAALRNTNDLGLTTGALADAMEASMRDEDRNAIVYSSVQCTDLPTAVTNFEEACQSGPNDWAPEGRIRDRSGTAPKKRKWKDRAKAKAARKARRNNR